MKTPTPLNAYASTPHKTITELEELATARTFAGEHPADDIKHKLKNARYADGRNAWDNAEDMTRDISAELRRRGIPHSPAQYDAGGNCLTCGECGRCPGVHTFEEIQKAARAARAVKG